MKVSDVIQWLGVLLVCVGVLAVEQVYSLPLFFFALWLHLSYYQPQGFRLVGLVLLAWFMGSLYQIPISLVAAVLFGVMYGFRWLENWWRSYGLRLFALSFAGALCMLVFTGSSLQQTAVLGSSLVLFGIILLLRRVFIWRKTKVLINV